MLEIVLWIYLVLGVLEIMTGLSASSFLAGVFSVTMMILAFGGLNDDYVSNEYLIKHGISIDTPEFKKYELQYKADLEIEKIKNKGREVQ